MTVSADQRAVVQALCDHDDTRVLAWKQERRFGPAEVVLECKRCELRDVGFTSNILTLAYLTETQAGRQRADWWDLNWEARSCVR